MDTRFEIYETKDHGVILRINDTELADEFDDFVNKDCYIFSELKFESNCVHIYFGQAGCMEKVRDLVEKFVSR